MVGRNFWPGSVADAQAGASDALRALERRGLVSARPTSTIAGEVEYGFRHALIRDVAYASVPRTRRARAHAETANWLEQLAADRREEFDELLAYHYSSAVAGEDADLAWAGAPEERDRIRQRAFDASMQAGAAALHRFAVSKAIALHDQALALAVDDRERAIAHEALADDHDALFHMDEAIVNYFAAVELVRKTGGSDLDVGRLAAKVAGSSQRWGAFRADPPVGRIREFIAGALKLDLDDRLRARILIGFGGLASYAPRGSTRSPITEESRRHLDESIAAAEEGRRVAERLGDAWLMYRANDILGSLYLHAGRWDLQADAVEREAAVIDQLPTAREQVDVLTTVCLALVAAGKYRQALEAGERAFEVGRAASNHERMHGSFALMTAAEPLGEWDRILEILPWHIEAAAGESDVSCPNVRGGPPTGATIMVWRGEKERALAMVPVDDRASERATLVDRSRVARYAALVDRPDVAGAIVDSMLQSPDRPHYHEGFGEFLTTLRLLDREADVARMVPIARHLSQASVELAPLADEAEGELRLKEGRRDEARTLFESAVRRWDELEAPFDAARSRELLAGVSEEQAARDLLEWALKAYRRLGAVPFESRVEEALARLPNDVSLAGA